MVSAKGLREEYSKDLKWLQDNCNHENLEWMQDEFAPGHSTGKLVKVCANCEKVLDSMYANNS